MENSAPCSQTCWCDGQGDCVRQASVTAPSPATIKAEELHRKAVAACAAMSAKVTSALLAASFGRNDEACSLLEETVRHDYPLALWALRTSL